MAVEAWNNRKTLMKYNIITIDDSRASYKDAIRKSITGIDEVVIPATNGRTVNLTYELFKRGLSIPDTNSLSLGEVGVWLSTFDCWRWAYENDEELLVFEDDAIINPRFSEKLKEFMKEVPSDYDFVCLWVPDNQRQDYNYSVIYDDDGHPHIYGTLPDGQSSFDFGAEHAAMVYNGYGNVAQLFSPKGSKFFMDRAQKAGLYAPVDCYQYLEAHADRCEGYAPKPEYADLVSYDWPETTIHTTERFGEVYK